MVDKYHPYPSRKDHDLINESAVVIAKMNLVIRDAKQLVDRMQAIITEHVHIAKQVRGEDGFNDPQSK